MQLIGQYDSPFVRRVAVALQCYGFAYEHLPWSTFGDADKVARYNPLRRVPVLLLDDGEALIESGAILDHLDEVAGPERALIARGGPERRAALRRIALATGAADKGVSYFYATLFAENLSPDYARRCEAQIAEAMSAIEAECALRRGDWWHGPAPGHDDIAVACVLRFMSEAWPGLVRLADYHTLAVHCENAEALPEFSTVYQRFDPPK
jgi:glutathione S-transferase